MIVAVPAETPRTIPVVDPTEATAGVLLLQVPPPASNSGSESPTHNEEDPVMGEGLG